MFKLPDDTWTKLQNATIEPASSAALMYEMMMAGACAFSPVPEFKEYSSRIDPKGNIESA